MKTQFTTMVLAVSALWGQSASPKWQQFSIGAPTANRSSFSRFGIRAEGVPLKRALARAYGVPENRLFGPEWIASERYAMTAIVADPKDLQPLLQQELSTVFHMLAHRESRVTPVYVLRPLPDAGAKLSAASATPAVETSSDSRGLNSVKLSHVTVAAFANQLADMVGRPVINETALDGSFDFVLSWKASGAPAVQAAVKDQLGLDLVDEQRAVDVVVIDQIEKLKFSK